MHSPRWASQCVFVTVPCQEEGWSVFSGRTPFGRGSPPLYWPLCGSLIELSCQQAARSQCRVHYVIQIHSGAPREVLGSADNSTAPSSNTQYSVASLCLSVLAWMRKAPILTIWNIPLFRTPTCQISSFGNPLNFLLTWKAHVYYICMSLLHT